MSSHNHSEDLTDIGLRHTFKNWVDRKKTTAHGRDQLLAAAAQQTMSLSQQKPRKFSFEWPFKFSSEQETWSTHPVYWYGVVNFDLLKVRMAFL